MSRNKTDLNSFSDELIAGLVEPRSTILDLGCGDGSLLRYLRDHKETRGQGVDLEESAVFACLESGIPAIQANLDQGLSDYPDKSYDYVILNQTLQVVRRPDKLLKEMTRIGRHVVVNYPNFGYILNRWQLFARGRMPVNKVIPYQWYDTPNIHFCTRKDFTNLCAAQKLKIEKEICLGRNGRPIALARDSMSTQVCVLLAED